MHASYITSILFYIIHNTIPSTPDIIYILYALLYFVTLYHMQGDAPIDDIALGQTPIGGDQLGTEGPYQE